MLININILRDGQLPARNRFLIWFNFTDLQFRPRLKNTNSLNYRTLEFFSTLAKKYLNFTIYYHDSSFKGLLYYENYYQPINSFHQKVIFSIFFIMEFFFWKSLIFQFPVENISKYLNIFINFVKTLFKGDVFFSKLED